MKARIFESWQSRPENSEPDEVTTMKSLISRIRWVRIGCLLCGIMAAGAIGVGYYRDTIAPESIGEPKEEKDGCLDEA